MGSTVDPVFCLLALEPLAQMTSSGELVCEQVRCLAPLASLVPLFFLL